MYIFMATFIGLIMNSKCQQTLIKLYFLQLIFWLFFGKQCLGDSGHVIKFELLNSLAKQHT